MAGMFDVTGKTVLITGGARGIGAMIAAGFLDHGAKVYLTSRRADPEQVRQLQDRGDCTYLPSNLSTVAGVKELARSAWASWNLASMFSSTTPVRPGVRQSRTIRKKAGTRSCPLT